MFTPTAGRAASALTALALAASVALTPKPAQADEFEEVVNVITQACANEDGPAPKSLVKNTMRTTAYAAALVEAEIREGLPEEDPEIVDKGVTLGLLQSAEENIEAGKELTEKGQKKEGQQSCISGQTLMYLALKKLVTKPAADNDSACAESGEANSDKGGACERPKETPALQKGQSFAF